MVSGELKGQEKYVHCATTEALMWSNPWMRQLDQTRSDSHGYVDSMDPGKENDGFLDAQTCSV